MHKLASAIFALLIISSQSALAQEPRPTIKPSDIVYMYSASLETYDAFGGTIVGWAGRPKTKEAGDIARFKRRVQDAHDRGMKYCGSVDFLVDFGGYIDFKPDQFMEAACVDLDGNPLRVPWLWDHKHKGHPAYWFCSNNPDYQTYLLDQAERAASAPIDGLHIDDYSGSSACSAYNGGCFCPYCMEGFRNYLQDHLSKETKERIGFDAKTFHYGEYLKSKGFTAATYKSKHWQCPLIDEFQAYQNEQMKATITKVFEHAETLRGQPLLRSINSSASSPRTLEPAKIIDYFCGEVHHGAEHGAGAPDPVFVYKIVESLGRRQTATASGQDWAWIKANEKPGLVQTWIAQAYAFGSVFMVPHNQWCYTKELGTHWWKGKPEDFAFINKFITAHRDLFDGFQQQNAIALVYSKRNYDTIKDAAFKLIEANVPFTIYFDGEDHYINPGRNTRIMGEDTFQHHGVVITGSNSTVPDYFHKYQKRWFVWDKNLQVHDEWKRHIQIEGAKNIRVSVRTHTGSDRRIIVHLLNQNYDKETDRVIPKSVKVNIDDCSSIMRTTSPRYEQAVIHQPNQPSQTVKVTRKDQYLSFPVPDLGFWGIVEIIPQK